MNKTERRGHGEAHEKARTRQSPERGSSAIRAHGKAHAQYTASTTQTVRQAPQSKGALIDVLPNLQREQPFYLKQVPADLFQEIDGHSSKNQKRPIHFGFSCDAVGHA
jgi:hypothetical protein